VPATADRVADHPEHSQDQANEQDNDAERPQDRDFRHEPDNEKKNAENNQEELLAAESADGWMKIYSKSTGCLAGFSREYQLPARRPSNVAGVLFRP
jgi:hypothetical protein